LSAGAEKRLWERCEQTGAIAASAIRVHSSAVGEALQSVQSKLDDVVAGSRAEAGDKSCAASIVVRVAPIGMTGLRRARTRTVMIDLASTTLMVHTSLLNGEGVDVQRRILIR